jgi:hypothetical protein
MAMGRHVFRAIAAVTALAFPLEAGASPATYADAWTTHSVPSVRFSIETPGAWIDITSASSKVLTGLATAEPSLTSLVKVVMSNKLIKFFGIDPSGKANVNVIAAPIGAESLHAWVSANVAQLKGLTELRGAVSVAPITLPGGAAYVVSYDETVAHSPKVVTLQYYAIHDGESYVITFTTSPSLEWKYASTFLQSARSVRFGKVMPVS